MWLCESVTHGDSSTELNSLFQAKLLGFVTHNFTVLILIFIYSCPGQLLSLEKSLMNPQYASCSLPNTRQKKLGSS